MTFQATRLTIDKNQKLLLPHIITTWNTDDCVEQLCTCTVVPTVTTTSSMSVCSSLPLFTVLLYVELLKTYVGLYDRDKRGAITGFTMAKNRGILAEIMTILGQFDTLILFSKFQILAVRTMTLSVAYKQSINRG
jgi:hypothetical protein